MNAPQLAQLILRLCRKRGMALRVERPADEAFPILHVAPKGKLTAYLRAAIPLCKPELIALLEAEQTQTVALDIGSWAPLGVCGACGNCGGLDYAVRPGSYTVYCVTCTTAKEVLEGELEGEMLKLRWGTKATPASHEEAGAGAEEALSLPTDDNQGGYTHE